MDRYEISLMTFMALWWIFNVVSVWLKAKQWHIKVLLGGTLFVCDTNIYSHYVC